MSIVSAVVPDRELPIRLVVCVRPCRALRLTRLNLSRARQTELLCTPRIVIHLYTTRIQLLQLPFIDFVVYHSKPSIKIMPK